MLSFFTNGNSDGVTSQQALHARTLGLLQTEADCCDDFGVLDSPV